MTVTFTLKNLSPQFFSGNGEGKAGSIIGLDQMSPMEKFRHLGSLLQTLDHCIKRRIGNNNSFRDTVELNQLLRNPVDVTCKIEPRRGYQLATFEFTPAMRTEEAQPAKPKRPATDQVWAWRHAFYDFRKARRLVELDRPAEAVKYLTGPHADYVRSRFRAIGNFDKRFTDALKLCDPTNQGPEATCKP